MSSKFKVSPKVQIKQLEERAQTAEDRLNHLEEKFNKLNAVTADISKQCSVQFGMVWANQQNLSNSIDFHDREILALAQIVRDALGKVTGQEITDEEWAKVQEQTFKLVDEKIKAQQEALERVKRLAEEQAKKEAEERAEAERAEEELRKAESPKLAESQEELCDPYIPEGTDVFGG